MPKRAPGRPRKFDLEKALDQAIQVFWKSGFEGASIGALTTSIGINRPSLYSAFGDKRSLYLKAIDRYASKLESPPLKRFQAEPDIKKAVAAFLVDPPSTGRATGCFLGTCVTTASTVKGVRERLRQGIEGGERLLASRFEEEKAEGVLPASYPSLERARLMFDLRQGLALRVSAGIDKDELQEVLNSRVKLIIDFTT